MYENRTTSESIMSIFWKQLPDAAAVISGAKKYPDIRGTVSFYKTPKGTLVLSEISNLPCNKSVCKDSIFAMHIHDGDCTDDGITPFPNSGTHYNPKMCEHPYHAGDLPPLFCSNGYALCMFLSDRFTVDEILGKAVIIHDSKDDFTTQPSGNSGEKIACGKIDLIKR